VIVNGEVVVKEGRLTKIDEKEALQFVAHARERLDPSIQPEFRSRRFKETD